MTVPDEFARQINGELMRDLTVTVNATKRRLEIFTLNANREGRCHLEDWHKLADAVDGLAGAIGPARQAMATMRLPEESEVSA